MSIFLAIMLPFLGTTLGSAMVFFVKDKLNDKVNKRKTQVRNKDKTCLPFINDIIKAPLSHL